VKTYNQQVVKKENKSLVMQVIKEFSPLSRTDVANKTGLNKGTVSSLVCELIDEQLVSESGPGKSNGGRRPVMLLFNEDAGYSIGVDIGVNYILGIITNLQGKIYKEKLKNFHDLTYEEIKTELYRMIDCMIASIPDCPYGLVGIGIGVPGTVNTDGKILMAPNLNWKNIDLKVLVEKKYRVPVIVENEANCGVYGEKKFGIGKDFKNMIYISIGFGIGGGLILNNHLYQGNNGLSGELGHMTIERNGEKCRCGDHGCWELYASERALVNQAKTAMNDPSITLEHLIYLAENEDPVAIELFNEIGKSLGIGINNIINIFNPDQVILGNRLAVCEKWLHSSLVETVQNHSLSNHQRDLHIHYSSLASHSCALGVAAFSTEHFLNNDLYHQNTQPYPLVHQN
jgi:glucokinase-like ROK family protein